MKNTASLALCMLLPSLTGCGTILTRTGHHSFGAYPYNAVGMDVAVVAVEKPNLKVLAFVSIPADLVLDTLFLPPDVIMWIAGKHKDGMMSDVH
jgi:uncharacterized protein YceK